MSKYTDQKIYNTNRKFKEHKVNPNEIKASLCLPADLNENIVNEILDVLSKAKFNKISVPLNTYRWMTENTADKTDTRVSTIGYIRYYNAETREFSLVVFPSFIDMVKSLGDVAVELQFTEFKEKLGTITKFNLIPVAIKE